MSDTVIDVDCGPIIRAVNIGLYYGFDFVLALGQVLEAMFQLESP